MRKLTLSLAAAAILAPLAAEAASSRDESLTAAIRQNGQACDRVVSAQKDILRSDQNRTLWYVDCDDRRYQVRYEGDRATEVTKLLKPRRPSR